MGQAAPNIGLLHWFALRHAAILCAELAQLLEHAQWERGAEEALPEQGAREELRVGPDRLARQCAGAGEVAEAPERVDRALEQQPTREGLVDAPLAKVEIGQAV